MGESITSDIGTVASQVVKEMVGGNGVHYTPRFLAYHRTDGPNNLGNAKGPLSHLSPTRYASQTMGQRPRYFR